MAWRRVLLRLQRVLDDAGLPAEAPPYHYGPSVAGLFGLVGAAGALCAPFRGTSHRPARPTVDHPGRARYVPRLLSRDGGLSDTLAGLIAGVILLLAPRRTSGSCTNRTRIYSIDPAARSRLNTVYMFLYFVGGFAGSYGGALAWVHFGWLGVCALGTAVLTLSLGTSLIAGQPTRDKR